MRNSRIGVVKQRMIDEMERCLGIVTLACKAAGCSRNWHYDMLKNDPEYKRRIEEISEVTVDFVESKLHKQISKGDTLAIIFYLKTKGQHRGYLQTYGGGDSGKPLEEVDQININVVGSKSPLMIANAN